MNPVRWRVVFPFCAMAVVAAAQSARSVRLPDLLLTDLLAGFVLLGDGLGAQPDPLNRDGLFFHHGPFGVQGNFGSSSVLSEPGRSSVQAGVGNQSRSSCMSS